MEPSISVVVPTYNRLQPLRRAIDSVLKQTRAADEIIIVDDGSTDGTGDTISNLYDRRLAILKQSNRGVSAARNAGIQYATGDWVALLDSDDEWLPNKLQMQTDLISRNTDCVLCHSDEIWIRNGVRVNPMDKHKKSGGDIYEQCLPLCAISPSSVLLKKQLLEKVGNFDESFPACEDYDLWLRICARHPVHYLDEKLLIKYGGHDDQLSKKHWGMDRFRIRALQNILESDLLTAEKRDMTLSTLNKKLNILLTGARKHNNEPLIQECTQAIKKYCLPEYAATQSRSSER